MNQRSSTASAIAPFPRPARSGPLVPALDRPEVRRGAAEHESVDALGRLERERHADHAAEREAAERDTCEIECVEEVDDAVGQRLDRDGLAGSWGAAVSGMVVADDAKVLSSAGTCASQSSDVVPSELESTSTGFVSVPSSA